MDKAAWMDQWMSAFVPHDEIGALFLGRFADPMYYVTSPLQWTPTDSHGSYKPIVVPDGFVTDLASIPRAFWSFLRPDGKYAWGAVVHDWLYWEQFTDRATADEVLRDIMKDFKISSGTVDTIYYALRLGGKEAWDANAKAKAAGAKRVLAKFPTSPLTTWAEWEVTPGVFENNS